MGIIKSAILLTSAYGTYRLLTDKDPITGKTILETFGERFRNLLGRASTIKEDIVEEVVIIAHEVDGPKTGMRRSKKKADPLGGTILE